jgi:hypothetical protein
MQSFLRSATSLVFLSVDRESITQFATTAARAVAKREGHRGLQLAATLLAEGLTAYASHANDSSRKPSALPEPSPHLAGTSQSETPIFDEAVARSSRVF